MFLTLMYHLVDDSIKSPMSISKDNFCEHMQVLKDLNVTLLRLQDVNNILEGEPAPKKPLLITFDDGYKNTVDTVLPILEKHQIPAVVSLCGSYVHSKVSIERTIHASQDFASVTDIKKWISSGRDIAGHTYSHPKLTSLKESEIEIEITLDKEMLEDTFNRNLDTFFYPFGSVNDIVKQIVRKHL
jgi:peptidoglycan/xylan/chitin deacetylase (PgdA/CDA1 family)